MHALVEGAIASIAAATKNIFMSYSLKARPGGDETQM